MSLSQIIALIILIIMFSFLLIRGYYVYKKLWKGDKVKGSVDILDTTTAYGRFVFTLFSAVAELELDINRERSMAGQESARRRGIKFGRKKGLSKEAQRKARLAEEYYRDETKKLTIKEILKLVDIKSKPTLYSYLQYRGRRNCKFCQTLFWDKKQEPDNSYCDQHINEKKEAELLDKLENTTI